MHSIIDDGLMFVVENRFDLDKKVQTVVKIMIMTGLQ